MTCTAFRCFLFKSGTGGIGWYRSIFRPVPARRRMRKRIQASGIGGTGKTRLFSLGPESLEY